MLKTMIMKQVRERKQDRQHRNIAFLKLNVGEGGSEWGIHVYPWLIHVNV